MIGRSVYLDTSAILKRYLDEEGSEVVKRLFMDAYRGEVKLTFSIWNIGEVIDVLDIRLRRGQLSKEEFDFLKKGFLAEIKRLTRLGVLEVVPVHSLILADAWKLIEKYHLCQADTLQIVSAKYAEAGSFYTADGRLHWMAIEEGLNSILLGGE
ncbi:type II toxin-antitoxin system VapC family toxin [Thermococcus waiotapuensis]|uniref:Type II toxin-antitoxin system VapC family toxin n=1 Tax=Thermococcus waiotapuensis TaxID=90909 RepID=A0AAE4NVV9_9EURY|nr:type II toxin-antitoxin system VapC family toxin [Thermococcus waiotapuensis]MDV3103620.1 type II toxin-antitoxin system VapC family toxin [Thermococcus waiotapuensis]